MELFGGFTAGLYPTDENKKVRNGKKQMPPILILALVAAVLALLSKDKKDLPQEQQIELEKLQKQLAESRKLVRHAQAAKAKFIASTGAKTIQKDK